jgi:hypothetical protein
MVSQHPLGRDIESAAEFAESSLNFGKLPAPPIREFFSSSLGQGFLYGIGGNFNCPKIASS